MSRDNVTLALSLQDAQMLSYLLGEAEERESYNSCNDSTYPEYWTVEQMKAWDRQVFDEYSVLEDPDRAGERDDPYIFHGESMLYLRNKVKAAIRSNE